MLVNTAVQGNEAECVFQCVDAADFNGVGLTFKVYEAQGKAYPAALCSAVENLYRAYTQDGVLPMPAEQAESELLVLSGEAKQYRILFAAHAHIDMNWMWGLPETVSVVIDTLQTMLNLMKEYPDFVFSQSQASTYEIIENIVPPCCRRSAKGFKKGSGGDGIHLGGAGQKYVRDRINGPPSALYEGISIEFTWRKA